MKELLGISLALVMLLGSVPFGFSEPLRVQLEQGIETDQLQCDNPNHVLVQRTNGNVACVTEKSAERTGWEIISESTIHQISYEFPLSLPGSSSGEPVEFPARIDLTISNLPKVGETAEIVMTLTNPNRDLGIEDAARTSLGFAIEIDNNFQFVDQSDVTTTEYGYVIGESFDTLANGESIIISATIMAVSEGVTGISGFGLDSYLVTQLHVGEDETLLLSDYNAKYPQTKVATVQQATNEYGEREPAPPG